MFLVSASTCGGRLVAKRRHRRVPDGEIAAARNTRWLGSAISRSSCAVTRCERKTRSPDLPEPDRAPFQPRLAQDLQVLCGISPRSSSQRRIARAGAPQPCMRRARWCSPDVASIRHAEHACGGRPRWTGAADRRPGGQTGWLNRRVRRGRGFFDAPIVLAGGIAMAMRCAPRRRSVGDLAYMGTKFHRHPREPGRCPIQGDAVASSADDILLTTA